MCDLAGMCVGLLHSASMWALQFTIVIEFVVGRDACRLLFVFEICEPTTTTTTKRVKAVLQFLL